MNRNVAAPVPEAIMQLHRQLDQFRSNRPARTKLPESLWQSAVELARQHGIYAVAHPLRLDYTRLKQRLGGMPSQPRKPKKTAFVELIADGAPAFPECVIELDESDPHLRTQRSQFFDHLTELLRHSAELKQDLSEWMPWNYLDTLARFATPAAA